jgi:hypothetical protein
VFREESKGKDEEKRRQWNEGKLGGGVNTAAMAVG